MPLNAEQQTELIGGLFSVYDENLALLEGMIDAYDGQFRNTGEPVVFHSARASRRSFYDGLGAASLYRPDVFNHEAFADADPDVRDEHIASIAQAILLGHDYLEYEMKYGDGSLVIPGIEETRDPGLVSQGVWDLTQFVPDSYDKYGHYETDYTRQLLGSTHPLVPILKADDLDDNGQFKTPAVILDAYPQKARKPAMQGVLNGEIRKQHPIADAELRELGMRLMSGLFVVQHELAGEGDQMSDWVTPMEYFDFTILEELPAALQAFGRQAETDTYPDPYPPSPVTV